MAGQMSRSSFRSRRQALGGVALAVLFLVAQASSFTHRLFVQHKVCAEHGEIVHAEGATAALQLAAGEARELRAAPTEATDHGHDHCTLTLPRREDVLSPAPAFVWLGLQVSSAIAAVDESVVALNGIELLRLAPKSSPPA